MKPKKKYSTLAGDAKSSAESKASKGSGKNLVYDKQSSIKKGRHVFKEAKKYSVGGRVGDPKKETAAARRRRLKNSQRSADEVLAKRAPQPSTRTTNKMSSEAKRTASVIKEGKKRNEKQKYRSEKTFRKESIRNISDARAARLKKRFDKNVAKEDRLKNEASRSFDDTRGTKKGSVSKSRSRVVDTTKGAATLSKSRGKKIVKAVSRDKAMKLKKKYSKFVTGGKVPTGTYTTSDGRKLSKSQRREDEIKAIKKKAADKAKKAHKQGEKRGRKVVGKRRVITAGNPRFFTGGVEYKNIYKKEQRKEERGKKKVQRYIDREARKYAPKRKGGSPSNPGIPKIKTSSAVKYDTAEKKRQDRCAKRGGRGCRRKQRRSGGSAAFR